MHEASSPRPITSLRHHDVIVERVIRHPKGKLLDVPCGEGALSVRMRDAGFDVTCADIDPQLFKAEGFEVRAANLNERLPFGDGQFDYVTCINGLHRVYAVDRALSEIARVLKPDGLLCLSFPNYSNLKRRLRFLLTGSVARSINNPVFHQVSDSPEANLRTPLMFPQVHFSLERKGMRVESIGNDSRRHSIAARLAAGLVRLPASMLGKRTRDDFVVKATNSAPILSGGRHIILEARKAGSNA